MIGKVWGSRILWLIFVYSEAVSLHCELHKCFSVLFCFLPLTWDKMAREGSSWVFPFLSAGLVKNRVPWTVSESFLFPFPCHSTREIFLWYLLSEPGLASKCKTYKSMEVPDAYRFLLSYWFFSLFSFLFLRTEWRLPNSLHKEWEPEVERSIFATLILSILPPHILDYFLNTNSIYRFIPWSVLSTLGFAACFDGNMNSLKCLE